jgi:hypothetical protein
MKAISKLLLSATLMSVLFISCSDDGSDNTPVAPTGNIIATVDGTAWEATGVAIVSDNFISVGGKSGGKTVQVTVFKDDAVGTYEVKGVGAITTYTPEAIVLYETAGSGTSSSIYFDNKEAVGSVIITEIDEVNKTVSGTFQSKVKSFIDGSTAELTTGSFSKVPYTTEVTTSTMNAKIDGVQFNSHIVVSAKAAGTLILNGQTLGGQQIITISVPEKVSVGTFTLGEPGFTDHYATYTTNGEKNYTSVSGTLKITAHNTTTKHIEGTFSFSAELFGPVEGDAISLTEGVFSITY